MVLCKVLKSKVEIDIQTFFLAMILFSLVTIGKQKKIFGKLLEAIGNFCHEKFLPY